MVTEGLVENARGFFVRALDLRETAQFFDAYMIVERSSAVLCKFSNAGFVGDLTAIQEKLGRSVQANAFLDLTKHNADFHLRIARATENSFLFEHAIRIHNLARRLAFFVYANESENEAIFRDQQDNVVKEHGEMIACIERSDRAKLIEITTNHSERLRVRVANYVAGSPRETFENIVGRQAVADGPGRRKRGPNVVAIDGGKS